MLGPVDDPVDNIQVLHDLYSSISNIQEVSAMAHVARSLRRGGISEDFRGYIWKANAFVESVERRFGTLPKEIDVNSIHMDDQDPGNSNEPEHKGQLPDTIHAPLDLTQGLLGVQVPAESEVVVWSDGTKTLVPVMREEHSGGNLLHRDMAMIELIAKQSLATDKSNHVCFTQKQGITGSELLRNIRSALSHGKIVMLRGYEDHPELMTMDSDGLLDGLGLAPDAPVCMHGTYLHFVPFFLYTN